MFVCHVSSLHDETTQGESLHERLHVRMGVRVCVCLCTVCGVQHKQWVGVTWINASFGHEGTAGEQARLTGTMVVVVGGLTEKRERERERNKERGARGMERAREKRKGGIQREVTLL